MNLSFFNTYFLLALPLLIIPIIIHLLSIKKARILAFSEIKFIKLAVTRTIKKIRLWQYLLLLLRILIITFLIFAFARPILQQSGFLSKNQDEPLAICLILDNSYSLGVSSEFETGKGVCENILKVLRSYDKVCFSLLSDKIVPVTSNLTSNTKLLTEKIKRAKISQRTTSILSGLNYGYSILKESNITNKQIIFVTDFAKHGFSSLDEKILSNFDKNIKIIFVDLGQEISNIAINEVVQSFFIKDQVKINVEVENFSPVRFFKVPVFLSINEQKCGYGFFGIDGYRKISKNLFYNFKRKDNYSGYVKLDIEDGLTLDNVYYVKLDVEEKKKVLCVDGDVKLSQFLSETFYLRLAFSPDLKLESKISSTVCVPEELEWKNLDDFSIIFLCNVSKLSQSVAKRLIDYVRKGGNLIYFLGDKINIEDYKKFNEEVFPADIIQVIEKEDIIDVNSISQNHSLFKSLDIKGFERVIFNKHYYVRPKSDTKVLANFKSNLPGIIEKDFKYTKFGKILIFPFPADRDWSNFPLRAIYLPFMQNIVDYLTKEQEKEIQKSIYVGDIYRKTFPLNNLPKKVEIVLPSNKVVPLSLISNNQIEFKELEEVGIYKLRYVFSGGLIKTEYFTVNLDVKSKESDLRKQEIGEIKKSIPSSGIFLIRDYKNIVNELILILRGREINKILIGLVIILLMLEGYLSIRRIK
ncbi:MAG: BatA domain-containing protein [Candidatus Firestonebacteria bacterium]